MGSHRKQRNQRAPPVLQGGRPQRRRQRRQRRLGSSQQCSPGRRASPASAHPRRRHQSGRSAGPWEAAGQGGKEAGWRERAMGSTGVGSSQRSLGALSCSLPTPSSTHPPAPTRRACSISGRRGSVKPGTESSQPCSPPCSLTCGQVRQRRGEGEAQRHQSGTQGSTAAACTFPGPARHPQQAALPHLGVLESDLNCVGTDDGVGVAQASVSGGHPRRHACTGRVGRRRGSRMRRPALRRHLPCFSCTALH